MEATAYLKSGISIVKSDTSRSETDDHERMIKELREDLVEMRKLFRNLKDMIEPLTGITALALRGQAGVKNSMQGSPNVSKHVSKSLQH